MVGPIKSDGDRVKATFPFSSVVKLYMFMFTFNVTSLPTNGLPSYRLANIFQFLNANKKHYNYYYNYLQSSSRIIYNTPLH